MQWSPQKPYDTHDGTLAQMTAVGNESGVVMSFETFTSASTKKLQRSIRAEAADEAPEFSQMTDERKNNEPNTTQVQQVTDLDQVRFDIPTHCVIKQCKTVVLSREYT